MVKEKGFSLIELIIVLIITAILAQLGFVSFNRYTRRSRAFAAKTALKNIKKECEANTALNTSDKFTALPINGYSLDSGVNNNCAGNSDGFIVANPLKNDYLPVWRLDPQKGTITCSYDSTENSFFIECKREGKLERFKNQISKAYEEDKVLENKFYERGNSRYVIVEGDTWEAAQANAVSLGGNLATINDKEENDFLGSQISDLEDELKILILPHDPTDDKNSIIEIRAGTGGDEAALFASDLYRMYSRFAERNSWDFSVLGSSSIGIGGLKEIIFSLKGDGAYGVMKYESGVHRVQRVPKTETSGRVHTSAATVAILPEAEDADINVVDADLKIDTYRASGAGGQHVNKTESAIRITHIPTGLVVTCQDESSQHKNKAAALKVLKSRLLAAEQEKLAKERAAARKSMVSTGDRSAKIRTYNFPQGRITDHRINFTSYNLDAVMDGDIKEIIEKLKIANQEEQLASFANN